MKALTILRNSLASVLRPRGTRDSERRSLNSGNLWPSFGAFQVGRSGLPILSPEAAFQIPSVSAAVQLLSQEISTLPLLVEREEGNLRTPAPRHPVFNLLRWNPNPQMTASRWRETAQIHMCLYGNTYSEVIFDGAGRPREIWLLEPRDVEVFTDPQGREVLYVYTPTGGNNLEGIEGTRERRVILPENMLHVRWLTSRSGLVGESPVLRCFEALSLTQAADTFAAKFYSGGAHLSGILSHPTALSETAFKALKNGWTEAHAGTQQAHSVAILEEGMSWTPTSISPEDGQMLPTREFQINEVARTFGIPAWLIGGTNASMTYSNIEQETLALYRTSLRPLLTNWEQECNKKLLGRGFVSNFDMSEVLRPDVTTRYNGYASALTAGWLTADEVRALEGMAPLPPEAAAELEAGEETDEADQEEEEPEEERALEPVLVAAVERVLVRQRKALATYNGNADKRSRFFEGQAEVWEDALEPILRSLELSGLPVPRRAASELGERFATTHEREAGHGADLELLWSADDIAREVISGLR